MTTLEKYVDEVVETGEVVAIAKRELGLKAALEEHAQFEHERRIAIDANEWGLVEKMREGFRAKHPNFVDRRGQLTVEITDKLCAWIVRSATNGLGTRAGCELASPQLSNEHGRRILDGAVLSAAMEARDMLEQLVALLRDKGDASYKLLAAAYESEKQSRDIILSEAKDRIAGLERELASQKTVASEMYSAKAKVTDECIRLREERDALKIRVETLERQLVAPVTRDAFDRACEVQLDTMRGRGTWNEADEHQRNVIRERLAAALQELRIPFEAQPNSASAEASPASGEGPHGKADAVPSPTPFVDIVFDGPPAHESGRFVEVENPQGASIRVGEWIDRKDGLWELRIQLPPQRVISQDALERACEASFDGHPSYEPFVWTATNDDKRTAWRGMVRGLLHSIGIEVEAI